MVERRQFLIERPSLTETAREHLATLGPEVLRDSAQIRANANAAFLQTRAKWLDVVVVGYGETRDTIRQGLFAYSHQEKAVPSLLVFGVNTTYNENWGRAEWDACLEGMEDQVRKIKFFQDLHPNVPLSFFTRIYQETPDSQNKPTITRKRRDAIGATINAYLQSHGGRFDDDMVLFSGDIDMVHRSPNFRQRMYQEIREGAHVVQPIMLHEQDSRFPQKTRVMQWYDSLMANYDLRFTGGRIHTVRQYLIENGFDPNEVHGGENNFLLRMRDRLGDAFQQVYCRDAVMITSNRRPFIEMTEEESMFRVYNNRSPLANMDKSNKTYDSEAFKSYDPIRYLHIRNFDDISLEKAEEFIRDMLTPHLNFGYGRRPLEALIWSYIQQKRGEQLGSRKRFATEGWIPTTEKEKQELRDAVRRVRELIYQFPESMYPNRDIHAYDAILDTWENAYLASYRLP